MLGAVYLQATLPYKFHPLHCADLKTGAEKVQAYPTPSIASSLYICLSEIWSILGAGENIRVVPGCSQNGQSGVVTVEPTFICKPSSAKVNQGNISIFFFFFLKKKLSWIQQGPAMRWWRHCNCLGFACVSLGREPGRTWFSSVPSLVNPISYCFLECRLWFLIKKERRKRKPLELTTVLSLRTASWFCWGWCFISDDLNQVSSCGVH